MYKGFNGENFFDLELYDISKSLISDMIPAGKRFCLRFRQDKVDSNPADLDKLVELNSYLTAQGKGVDVIFCANINEPADVAFSKLSSTIEAGINVIAVEFGNETYSKEQTNFNFDTYKTLFTPLFDLVKASYPTMPCLVFLAPRPKESGVLGGRADHSRFNTAALAYINSEPMVYPVVHIYFNGRECPTLNSRPANVAYDPAVYYPEWDAFYAAVRTEAESNLSLWTNTLDYIYSSTNSKGIYITEWGFDSYGTLKNTMSMGATALKIWTTFGQDSRITALCQHNGLSTAGAGMITPAGDKDINPAGWEMLPRIDYFVYKLYRASEDTGAEPFYYTSPTQFSNKEVNSLDGKYAYSSAGATAWMGKGSKPSLEVGGISTRIGTGYTSTENPYSIGFMKEIHINQLPIANAGSDISLRLPRRGGSVNTILTSFDSYDPDGLLVDYKWTFEGMEIATTPDVSLVFVSPGTYVYTLEVTDNEGATASDSITVTVSKRGRFLGGIFDGFSRLFQPKV